ncbi:MULTISPECIES: hypothetical protein [unclassified Kineosporia]|jgi:hypothetical protein|uniref:hypothetical protein n=1 Tax=unclassified Kineosporia TaxID=2626061 RepID=UPI0018E95371|nr:MULTISPECIES: hypothetical protein [unclassified Kineosporia]MBI4941615.1 hypothetical protein [Actinomycetota bacterium]
MKRLFWIALGATAGVLVVRKLTKTVDQYSPEGVGRSLSNLADAVRDAADVVREAMDEREQELRVALGVDSGVITQDEARALLENPTRGRGDR